MQLNNLLKMTNSIALVDDTQLDNQRALQNLDSLAVHINGEVYYEAAEPGYKGSFTRDSLIAMSLIGDIEKLTSQIEYSANRLGEKTNPATGEEQGKAHHQLPSVKYKSGLSTDYIACDTTAEFLRAIAVLAELGHTQLLEKYTRDKIPAAIGFIKRRVDQTGLFQEDPAFAGVSGATGNDRHFALKVTYWKDSELNCVDRREPNYPIVYSLPHFQNAAALRRIAHVLGDDRLDRFGRYMQEAGLRHLWRNDHFVVGIDSDGEIDPPSSDSLLTLLYVPTETLPNNYAEKVEQYMQQLETDVGYRSGIPVAPDVDPYHMQVWVHEQALLHATARLHNLSVAEKITLRITPYLLPRDNLFPELVSPESHSPEGNAKQLWSIGAYFYFQNPDRALL